MKLRKVMALTLAGTMALAAVGCGSDASTTNDAPAQVLQQKPKRRLRQKQQQRQHRHRKHLWKMLRI